MIKWIFLDDFDALSNVWEEDLCVCSVCSVCGVRSIHVLRFLHIFNELNEMFEDCDDMRTVFEANKVFTFAYEGRIGTRACILQFFDEFDEFDFDEPKEFFPNSPRLGWIFWCFCWQL